MAKEDGRRGMNRTMKLVCFISGLVLGLAFIVMGISRVATNEAFKIGTKSEGELKSTISSLASELREMRANDADIAKIAVKETEMMDMEEELLRVQKGFYSDMRNNAWLSNVPVFIVGIIAVAAAVVVYKYA